MKNEKITLKEFIDEVWEIEHVKISIDFKDNLTHLVDHYPYTEPMDGECTVDELLNQRIRPILNEALAPVTVIMIEHKEN